MNYNMNIIQKVIKVGSSAAVVIPKESMKELGLKIGNTIRVEIDARAKEMIIARKDSLLRADRRVADLAMKFIKRYRSDLEQLRDK